MIFKLMRAKGVTCADLAKESGVDVRLIERGVYKMDRNSMAVLLHNRIIQVLGMTTKHINWIMGIKQ